MAVRRARQRELGHDGLDADRIEARNAPSPEERVVGADEVQRSAEALQRCKPQEIRALWLRAQGNSYDEIQAITGWTRTKVNRCLYEGRQSFLTRYAGIESGAECERWRPLLSALVDGEASTDELLELRPHLRRCAACRAAVRELHRAQGPLAIVFPALAVAVTAEQTEPAGQLFVRVFESVSNWLNERAAASLMRAQIVIDGAAGSATKATAVAATAATVAGGGAVAIEHTSRAADRERAERPPAARVAAPAQDRRAPRTSGPAAASAASAPAQNAPGVRHAAPRAARGTKAAPTEHRTTRSSSSRGAAAGTRTAPASAPAASTPRAPSTAPAPPVTSAGAGDLDLE
jgi:hypothetical protein